MILNKVNGQNVHIEIHPLAYPFGSRFDTVTLTANDMDALVKLDPFVLQEWVLHIQSRFPPGKTAKQLSDASIQHREADLAARELADLLS